MARDLAVIIVSWNVQALLLDALRTLYADLASTRLDSEVWVVDNASHDDSVQAIRADFPQVKLIASAQNLGFAGGNNLALRTLGFSDQPNAPQIDADSLPRAVFLLNADTRVEPGAIQSLWEALFNQKKAGIVGAQLFYGDGSFQDGAFAIPGLSQLIIDLFPLSWLPRRVFNRLYNSRWNGRYPRRLSDSGQPFAVGHTLGATLFMRREAILESGLFDERFFMYGEEVDWSIRIRQAGWQIYCQPQAHIIHLAGQSTKQVRVESLVNLWKSRLLLYKKHYSPLKYWLARRLVRIGVALRLRQARGLPLPEREAATSAYRRIGELVSSRALQ